MNSIMVVEDETMLLQAIVKKLKIKKIETISCSGGQQALDYLNELEQLPDAIWLDYYLEGMNGLEFIHQMKKIKRAKDIPVIIVSNSANSEKVHSLLALGASSYILKARHTLEEITDHITEFVTSHEEAVLKELSEE